MCDLIYDAVSYWIGNWYGKISVGLYDKIVIKKLEKEKI